DRRVGQPSGDVVLEAPHPVGRNVGAGEPGVVLEGEVGFALEPGDARDDLLPGQGGRRGAGRRIDLHRDRAAGEDDVEVASRRHRPPPRTTTTSASRIRTPPPAVQTPGASAKKT